MQRHQGNGASVRQISEWATKALAGWFDSSSVIEPVRNRDYAMGIVGSPPAVLIAGTLAAMVVAILWARSPRATGPWWMLPVFLGGAASNVVDRALLGGVRDFVATPWFVFNIADLAILMAVGVFYLTLAGRGRSHLQPERR